MHRTASTPFKYIRETVSYSCICSAYSQAASCRQLEERSGTTGYLNQLPTQLYRVPAKIICLISISRDMRFQHRERCTDCFLLLPQSAAHSICITFFKTHAPSHLPHALLSIFLVPKRLLRTNLYLSHSRCILPL